MKRPHARERGFTLIEIMLAAAIGSIVVGALFGTMLMQQQSYIVQLNMSEASQNARASLDIIRQNLRTAGWGMVSTAGAHGVPAVGTCYAATVATQSTTCNNQLAITPGTSSTKSDRMRMIGIEPGKTFSRATTWSGSNKLTVTDSTPVATRTPLQGGQFAIISGQCNDDGKTYNGIVKITAVSPAGTPTIWTYTFDPAFDVTYPTFTCTSMKDGFAFGHARIVEFYIDRSLGNTDATPGASAEVPELRMIINRLEVDPVNGAAQPQVVAYDIESLQVRYGLDCGHVPVGSACATATSQNADDIIDPIVAGQTWCNDLQLANCNTGLPTVLENQQRIMAVQVAVVPRTRGLARRILNDELHTTTGPQINIFDGSVPGDAYKHWVYRATVALRNNQLAITGP